jgi:uncharacterized protein YneF (UPF0154 family)
MNEIVCLIVIFGGGSFAIGLYIWASWREYQEKKNNNPPHNHKESPERIFFSDAIRIMKISRRDSYSVSKLKKVYRQMAKKAHPDHGGSMEQFIQLKAAYDYLNERAFEN